MYQREYKNGKLSSFGYVKAIDLIMKEESKQIAHIIFSSLLCGLMEFRLLRKQFILVEFVKALVMIQ